MHRSIHAANALGLIVALSLASAGVAAEIVGRAPALITASDTIPVPAPTPVGDSVPGAWPLPMPDTVSSRDTIPVPDRVPAADTVPTALDTIPLRGAEQEPGRPDTVPDPQDGESPLDRSARRGQASLSDSIFQSLLNREGYSVMEYGGDSATFHATSRVLRLFGPADVKRGQDELTAEDTIVYREDSRLVMAYGSPKLTGDGQPIEGNVMFYDLNTRRATVLGGRTQISEAGAQWFVRGDVTAEGNERVYATKSIFTTDDRDEPAYYFEADNIKVIRDRVLVGRPARLYFRNVPVFWLPFVFQDLTRGRRSGLLTPEFSMNDLVRTSSSGAVGGGTGRQLSNIGMYWAINDYADAQLSGGWRSGDYRSLTGAFQYRVTSQFLQGNFNYTRYWQDAGSQELRYNGSTSWRPDERTNMSINANYSSSSRFQRQISTNPVQSVQTLGSSGSLNRRFDWGSIDLGGNRQQSLASGQINTVFPTGSLVVRPITFFRAANPAEERWYSNSSVSLNLRGSQQNTSYGELARPQDRASTLTRLNASPVLQIGNFDFSPSMSFDRTELPARPEIALIDSDSVIPALSSVLEEKATWGTGFSYGIPLMGETRLTPSISVNQELRRDSTTLGALEAGPLRRNFSTGLNTTLYGFFPGFGGFTSIRHKITPSFSYNYSPAVGLAPGQAAGSIERFAESTITLGSINQTFEAKMRPRPRQQGAMEDADTAAVAGDTVNGTPAAAEPPEETKVTLLAISTSGFTYDFQRAARGLSGLKTRTVNNSITSDYLRGLQLSLDHDLFDASEVEQPGDLGRFSPMLTQVSTRFSLGEDTPILRWFLGRGDGDGAPEGRDAAADTISDPQADMAYEGSGNRQGGVQPVARGPWGVDVQYSYTNYRALDSPSHDFVLQTRFSPTGHWSVSWYTTYGVGDGFGSHMLTLTRDLYRWEANFNFSRTVTGNTSFDVLVRLKDLPDIKVDYREHNIGARGQ